MKDKKNSEDILKEVEEYDKSKRVFKKQPISVKITKAQVALEKKKELKQQQEIEKREREEKRIIETDIKNKKKNSWINRKRTKFKSNIGKIKSNKNKIIDSEDKNLIKRFITSVLVNGLLINFSLYCIFNIKFNFYNFIGWGIALWYIENNLVKFIKSIIQKDMR